MSDLTSPPLRRGVIGVPGMVFMVIAAAAPLTAMASNLALSVGAGAGVGTLGWIVLVGGLLAVFTAGYVALSQQVVSAGAYHAFVTYGLGTTLGAAVAYVALLAYNVATLAMVTAFGFFIDVALSQYVGLDLPWFLYAAAALGIVGLLGFVGADVSTRVTAAISLLQLVLLVVFVVAVLLDSPSRFDAAGFTPSEVFSGNFSLTLVFVLLSFACYEAAASYGEECNAPHQKIKRATYIALGVLVLVFLTSTWALIAAYDDAPTAAAADPGALLNGAAERLLGSDVGAVITVTVAVSFFAAAVSFHNLSVRYFFALARARLLPRAWARTSRRGTPVTAVLTQVAICAVILTGAAASGAAPLSTVFPAASGITSLGFIVLTCMTSISAAVAAFRGRLPGPALQTRWAPIVSAVGLGAVGVLIATNYSTVTGSDALAISLMPVVFPIIGLVAWQVVRRSPARQVERALEDVG
ncbi:hypothetical protein ASF37_04460 [Aeromicrobium sp. Leaf289]|uniref:APC family permease n=1 Tax=Aeromicrobium sp. Leaf289 TaxID=1736324 RepID=UPI0006FECABC|nr:APC family permease [Aeromicrobium sp. Leaf289]KQP77891.1 hypothetical protein ASF37_04460 [Aeromicrobium sp. Leaf289]